MLERRRGPQRPRRAMSTVAATWARRVLLLGLAIGVVVMHHLVGSHQHDRSAVADAPTAAVAAAASDPTAPPTGGAHAAHAAHEGSVPSPSDGGVPAHHQDGGDPAGVMVLLHMCLAVLGAALMLVALVFVVSWWRAPREHRSALRLGVASLWRPPPVPQRLAQLQILRL